MYSFHTFCNMHYPFHSQEWSILNSSCSLSRNITSHSKENLTFHIALLRWKIIFLPILTTSLLQFSFKGWGNVLFELGSERVKVDGSVRRCFTGISRNKLKRVPVQLCIIRNPGCLNKVLPVKCDTTSTCLDSHLGINRTSVSSLVSDSGRENRSAPDLAQEKKTRTQQRNAKPNSSNASKKLPRSGPAVQRKQISAVISDHWFVPCPPPPPHLVSTTIFHYFKYQSLPTYPK